MSKITNVTSAMLVAGDDIFPPKRIANVVKPSSNPDAVISCNLFKSESLYTADKKAPFSAYVRGALEPVAGGHYYARSFLKNTFQSASCTIPLSKCKFRNSANGRVGYISLGISTEGGSKYHHFDVGLANRGNGWYPSIWGQKFITYWNPDGPTASMPNIIHRDDAAVPIAIAPGDATVPIPATATVTVKVEVGRTSEVDWMRATFSYDGKTGKIAINVPRGTLFPNDNHANPTTRFNRFMSLVPAQSGYQYDDGEDGSMLEGWMENLKIGNTSWTAANLQHVWDVQDENVPTIQISTLADANGVSNRDHAVIHHTFKAH